MRCSVDNLLVDFKCEINAEILFVESWKPLYTHEMSEQLHDAQYWIVCWPNGNFNCSWIVTFTMIAKHKFPTGSFVDYRWAFRVKTHPMSDASQSIQYIKHSLAIRLNAIFAVLMNTSELQFAHCTICNICAFSIFTRKISDCDFFLLQ